MNNRRKVVLALGALSVGLARAQPAERAGKLMRVGILSTGTRPSFEVGSSKIFVDGMRELGWVEGRNILYDRVYADNDASRLPALAAELVARSPDLIWVVPGQAARAALASTRTIPIVFAAESNVVERGLVKTLARPGGNVTGVQNIGRELGGKRLHLLKQALPKITRVGVLVNSLPTSTGPQEFKVIEKAAATLGVTVNPAMAKVAGEFDAVIASLVKNREKPCSSLTPLFSTVGASGFLNWRPADGCRWSEPAANLPITARSCPTARFSAIKSAAPRRWST